MAGDGSGKEASGAGDELGAVRARGGLEGEEPALSILGEGEGLLVIEPCDFADGWQRAGDGALVPVGVPVEEVLVLVNREMVGEVEIMAVVGLEECIAGGGGEMGNRLRGIEMIAEAIVDPVGGFFEKSFIEGVE